MLELRLVFGNVGVMVTLMDPLAAHEGVGPVRRAG